MNYLRLYFLLYNVLLEKVDNYMRSLNILLDGLFTNGSGFAEDNLRILSAIRNGEHKVQIRNRLSGHNPNPTLRLFESTHLETNDVYICNLMCSAIEARDDFRINIARTTFETDRLPKEWVTRLNAFDEIWVPSTFNAGVFRDAGVTAPTYVIPETIDFHIFDPEGDAWPLPTGGRFVFLSIFDWQVRKGFRELLQAYMEEFTARDNVALVVKTYDLTRHRDPVSELTKCMELFQRDDPPPVYVLNRSLQIHEIAALYRAANAFVLPTHGEGWGRPLFEAMAMGLPTVATDWGGQKDFMNETNSYLIPSALGPAKSEFSVFNGHLWAYPSISVLKQRLRQIYELPTEAMIRGQRARHDLLVHFNESVIEARIHDRLDALSARIEKGVTEQ
ncbi:glycosyl transferase group 1 [Alicyclobacillus hesperidum URH17-3-68]|nr:glycosyl transferase group 1 [Alicyclobacillus hesperidum URH17-3-68]